MTCKCGSERIVSVNSKCSDLCFVSYKGMEHNGYVPYDLGIGGGDYVEFDYCFDCGQIQGQFPISDITLEQAFEE